MSIDYCSDCERIVEGNTTTHYLTESNSAYEDGEYVTVCDFCGNDDVSSLSEDPPEPWN
jgi:hypothetical protein